MQVFGAENIPDEPVLFVGNHCQLYGPIACELFMPVERYTWCAGQMMKLKEVPSYTFEDFWSFKPRSIQWFFRLASYLIAPICVCIFNNANTIAVYRDNRIVSTFKKTIQTLQNNTSVVIFPEHNKTKNNIIYEFEENFIDIARLYHKRTGHEVAFVPMYIAPKLKGIWFGEPIRFSAGTPIEDERRRICDYLMDTITDTARSLPRHTVVPYRNIPKRNYPTNKDREVKNNEETRC